MTNMFDITHLKDRYRAMISNKSVSVHATIAEMLGTGIVVLVGTSAVQMAAAGNGSFLGNAVVFGVIYFAVMCAISQHGSAHLNPAITIASMLAGMTGAVQAVAFIVAQVLGAIIGSALVLGLTPDDERDDELLGGNAFVRTPGLTKGRAFGAEILGTFILTYIYLQVFHHPKSQHRVLAPLAVGLAYMGLLAYAGPTSGGSLNPARTLGPAAVSGEGDDLWIWTIGPLIGALCAVPLHLLSVTDLPEYDNDGRMIKRSASAVDIENPAVKGGLGQDAGLRQDAGVRQDAGARVA